MLEIELPVDQIVKIAGGLISVAAGLLSTWRGRARWEPAETDIPRGPQRVAGLLCAVALALIWGLLSGPAHVSELTHAALLLSGATFISLLAYGYLVATQTYKVGRPPTTIIGGFTYREHVEQWLTKGDARLTIQDCLSGLADSDPDKIWSRSSRAAAKVMFVASFIALNVCGTIALACASIVLIETSGTMKSTGADIAPPVDRRVVHIGIVHNGTIFYNREIAEGFMDMLDSLLEPAGYAAHYETELGFPERKDDALNEQVFERLLARFDGDPDYVVTIGTQISKYACSRYLNRFPIIFLGVTDPVRSQIVSQEEPDSTRGKIAGVRFDPPFDVYASFLGDLFPGKRIGFVCNSEYEQDVFVRDRILEYLERRPGQVAIIPIAVSTPRLSAEQQDAADVFFGRYFVTSNFRSFMTSTGKPFVAADISNVYKGAIAAISANTTEIGEIGARDIVVANLLYGKSLADIAVLAPTSVRTGVNVVSARKYGIAIPENVMRRANAIVR